MLISHIGATSLATSTDVAQHVAVAVGYSVVEASSSTESHFACTIPGGEDYGWSIGVVVAVAILVGGSTLFPATEHVFVEIGSVVANRGWRSNKGVGVSIQCRENVVYEGWIVK